MPTAKKAAPSRSGNPAKRAQAKASVTPVSGWKKKGDDAPGVAILLPFPSGNTMRVRNRGFRSFIQAGIIPNSLLGVIEEALAKGKEPDLGKLQKDDGTLELTTIDDMFTLMENVMIECSVEPKVHPLPEDPDERSDELLYIDEIDEEDKLFLFQWVTGGTRDVERFRSEYAAHLATLPGGEDLGSPAKPASSARRARR